MFNAESFLKGGEELASVREVRFALPGDALVLLSVYRLWMVKLVRCWLSRKVSMEVLKVQVNLIMNHES
jgi:hypothetical protein